MFKLYKKYSAPPKGGNQTTLYISTYDQPWGRDPYSNNIAKNKWQLNICFQLILILFQNMNSDYSQSAAQ